MMTKRFFAIHTLLIVGLLDWSSTYSQPAVLDSIINEQKIREVVEFLASDSLKGRLTGSKEALIAANYIRDEFVKAGLQPFDSTGFLREFGAGLNYGLGYNVIGYLPGNSASSEMVIFSAHYDHIGTISTNPYATGSRRNKREDADTIYNGANDNASGTAALISLAYYFGTSKQNKRSLLFIAFSGEELGLVGSGVTMARIKDPSQVSCVVNLEMLGRGKRPFITGSEYGNFQYLLNKELARIDKEKYGKNFFMSDHYPEQNLFIRSDNYPFAQFRIPAHTIMVTSAADKYYHSVDDEPSTLDFTLIQNVVRATALAVSPIVQGKVRPHRIDLGDNR